MKMKFMKKLSSFFLCMMLIMAMAFVTTGCSDDKQNNPGTSVDQDNGSGDVTTLGEGKTTFAFTVVDKDGNETNYEIYTDKEIVGEALLDLELIAGENGEYGLYVKTVNGITADYDVDQTYWAFYVNGEYAMSGVDTTEVEEGASYAFKVEK